MRQSGEQVQTMTETSVAEKGNHPVSLTTVGIQTPEERRAGNFAMPYHSG
jgi:hypothetical protein